MRRGKLEVLQVLNQSSEPITFESQAALNSPDQVALHTYGNTFKTRWVTIHDTAVDGTTPFNANELAKAASATPFKRPENGQFQPGSGFRKFFFDETGDTNREPRKNGVGGWGSIMKLSKWAEREHRHADHALQSDEATAASITSRSSPRTPSPCRGRRRHAAHAAQRARSAYVWNVNADYSNPANQPVRWLAEGRDASATLTPKSRLWQQRRATRSGGLHRLRR